METYLLLTFDDGATKILVCASMAVKRGDDTIIVAHICEKWKTPNGDADLSEVDVIYFDVVLMVQRQWLEVWRGNKWEVPEKVHTLQQGDVNVG